MPRKKKRRAGGRSSSSGGGRGGKDRAAARRERKQGRYLSPGDGDYQQLAQQLRKEGLTLKDVPGDGNCLFRAFADQLPYRHDNLRHTVVQHMRANEEDYAPFVEDDITFEAYMDDLAKDGTYAGNDVIVAMTRCYGVDVVIHQLATPNWAMQAPSLPVGQDRRTLHVVYLRGEHYCSVRPQQPGHALPALASKGRDEQAVLATSSSSSSSSFSGALPLSGSSEGRSMGSGASLHCERGTRSTPPLYVDPLDAATTELMQSSGCQDEVMVRQVLMETGGAMDLAIVELLQLMTLCDPDTAEAAQLEAGGDARATSVASSNGGEGQTSMCAGATSHETLPFQRDNTSRGQKQAKCPKV